MIKKFILSTLKKPTRFFGYCFLYSLVSCSAGQIYVGIGHPEIIPFTRHSVKKMTSWENMKLESFTDYSEENNIEILESTYPDFCIKHGDGGSSSTDCYVPFKEDKYIVYKCFSSSRGCISFLSENKFQSNSEAYKRYYGQGSPRIYDVFYDKFTNNWYIGILIIILSTPIYIVISLIVANKDRLIKK